MAQSLNVKIAGLYSFPSDLSAVPPGALSEATNIVLDQDDIAAPHRGFGYLSHGSGSISPFSDATYRANQLFFYQGKRLSHYGNNSLAYHDDTTGWTAYSGTFIPPSNTVTGNLTTDSAIITSLSSIDGLVAGQLVYGNGIPSNTYLVSFTSTTATLTKAASATSSTVSLTFVVAKARSAQANQNFYITTSTGVKKLDTYNGTPSAIGVPPGLTITTALTATVTPTATTANTSTTLTSLSSATGLAIGMSISGTGIPANTLITAFTSTTITLSQAATSSGAGRTMTCSAPATWLDAATTTTAKNTTAYRTLWGIKDANRNNIQGAPSAISQIANPGSSAVAVNVNLGIPSGITTAHYFQIYRSAAVVSGETPTDEGQLVYEGNPLSADISAGFVTICDVVPDALRRDTIYTAESVEGLANENFTPPLARDLAVFRGCLFFANTSGLQNYDLSLLGVGTPSGIQSGDTITIDGVAYTADTTETTSTGHFKVTSVYLNVTTGTTSNGSASMTSVGTTTGIAAGQTITGTNIPAGTYVISIVGTTVTMSQAATGTNTGVTFTGASAAQAIRDTALSLVNVINRYTSSTVYAEYDSNPLVTPGQISIRARTVGTASFSVISSRSTCWSPALPTSGTSQSSTRDVQKNAIFWSKQDQPEAVPVGNFDLVGSADKNILRILALRDSLFIIKEDGTYILTGTDPSTFIVRPLDNTSVLIAPDSAVSLNNQIFCLTTQGVVSLSEIGAPIVSHPIEGELTALISKNYALLQNTTFGVAYESSRAYYLFCMTDAADDGPTQYFRYNYISNKWTKGTLQKGCGGVNPVDDRLYLGNRSLNIVDVERKSLTYSDYANYQSTETISNVTGRVVTISSPDTIIVGSIIYQSDSVFGTVESVDPIAGTATTTLTTDLVAGSADVLAPPDCRIAWCPITLDNPGFSKQLREATLLFLSEFNGEATVGFSTDLNPGVGEETVAGGAVGGWGLFAWGGPSDTAASGALNTLGVPWGGDPRRRPVRVSVTRNHQRCTVLTVSFDHAYAYSPWKLQGLSLIGNLVSERVAN